MAQADTIYKPCKDIKREYPDTHIDKELVKRIATEFRTLPSFESTVFEDKFVKHYSLERNELLKCRWKQYRENVDKIVVAPFQFPGIRMKLQPGPGVDWRGQMPIPNELFMKRGIVKKEDKAEHKTKKEVKKSSKKEEKKDAKKDEKKDVKKDEKKVSQQREKKDAKLGENKGLQKEVIKDDDTENKGVIEGKINSK